MIIPPPDFGKDELLDATVIAVGNEGATVDTRSLKGRILFDDMKWARRKLDPNNVEKFKYSEKAKPPDILKVGDIVKVAVKGVDAKTKETLFVLEQEPIVEGALLALDRGQAQSRRWQAAMIMKRANSTGQFRQRGSLALPLNQ